MPFEKIYSQRLRTFPPELRDSSIQYRELKKIIGCLVDELNDLGLSPETLRQAISRVEFGGEKSISEIHTGNHTLITLSKPISVPQRGTVCSKILYEVISQSGKSFPQLRVYTTATLSGARTGINSTESVRCSADTARHGSIPSPAVPEASAGKTLQEFVIPLVHDAQFFHLFERNIQTLTAQMEKIHSEFSQSVHNLVRMISHVCQPASVAANYRPYSSISTHPGMVDVKVKHMKSDLYAWREIFGLFVESDVFEHTIDGSKVEWSIEESEKRLNAFADKVTKRWLSDNMRRIRTRLPRRRGCGCPKAMKFKHKQSEQALQIFIKLNILVLDIRKVFQANIEGIKKLVKKHTEHTALPLSCSFSENSNTFCIGHLHQSSCTSLPELIHPRLFIREIAEKLFSVVPNQDDYSCAICTCIAFKPIRLSCTHLFCSRCLVKMQRRREGNCPMCRASSVLGANATNVDWGLLNFMEDWFPREAREKLRTNEREAVDEQLAAWRVHEAHCTIM